MKVTRFFVSFYFLFTFCLDVSSPLLFLVSLSTFLVSFY